MSFFIYAITLAVEIYLYFKIVSNVEQIATLGLLMAYILLFLLFGAFLIYLKVRPVVIMPFLAILSLGTAVPSIFYYDASFGL
jgi:hypothetical protein